jgi:hypothetical protein
MYPQVYFHDFYFIYSGIILFRLFRHHSDMVEWRHNDKGDTVDFLDRRRAERFKAEIPIELKQGTGVTKDFSTDGILFVTDQVISVGEQIEFVMLLNHTGTEYAVRLRCRGDVLRVESGAITKEVATAITEHLFEEAQDRSEHIQGKSKQLNQLQPAYADN